MHFRRVLLLAVLSNALSSTIDTVFTIHRKQPPQVISQTQEPAGSLNHVSRLHLELDQKPEDERVPEPL